MIDLILLAAGSGKRMKSSTNKQFLKIDDKPILIHSLEKRRYRPKYIEHA